MPEQNTELNSLDRVDLTPGGLSDESAADQASPVSGENPLSPAEQASNVEPISGAKAIPQAEFDQLKAERDQLVDRLARMQAEYDNARKRAERERLEFRDYATGSVVEKILPVLDNFELALKADGSAKQLRSGIELIVKQMEEVLRQMQVLPVPTVGEAFDPRVHEALGTVDRDDIPDQHVAEEIRRGYKLRERLLRPAMVRVAHNPKQTSE